MLRYLVLLSTLMVRGRLNIKVNALSVNLS
jgi:hypothetical protein